VNRRRPAGHGSTDGHREIANGTGSFPRYVVNLRPSLGAVAVVLEFSSGGSFSAVLMGGGTSGTEEGHNWPQNGTSEARSVPRAFEIAVVDRLGWRPGHLMDVDPRQGQAGDSDPEVATNRAE
jgi:hypothetical protein